MDRTKITDRYLEALGLHRQAPDLAFLGEIVRRHVARFTFCSVGPRLGNALPLDLASLYERIVVRGRGGYCFEQNGLLYEVLAELGFSVTLYLARVVYNRDVHPGLTHRITLVKLDEGEHLVDVGFGPLGPSAPVSMSNAPSAQGYRTFRVAEPKPGELHLQTLKEGEFFSLYRFELNRYGQADCELGHFFSHRHPEAVFVSHLVASRILAQEIRSLRNRDYLVMTADGDQRQPVEDAAHLRSVLRDVFDIDVTAGEADYLFANTP